MTTASAVGVGRRGFVLVRCDFAREVQYGSEPLATCPFEGPPSTRTSGSGPCGRLSPGKDLEGEQSPWKDRASRRWQRQRDVTDSTTEQGHEAETPSGLRRLRQRRQCRFAASMTTRFSSEARVTPGSVSWWVARRICISKMRRRNDEINDKVATTAVTQRGCRRGEFFEGYEPRREERNDLHGCFGRPEASRETRRTPWSVVGCNKPANLRAEEAVEVVRNHEDGTGLQVLADLEPKVGIFAQATVSAGSGRSKECRRRGVDEAQERRPVRTGQRGAKL